MEWNRDECGPERLCGLRGCRPLGRRAGAARDRGCRRRHAAAPERTSSLAAARCSGRDRRRRVTAALAVLPQRGGNDPFLADALAAIGHGPVLHARIEARLPETHVVELATGRAVPQTISIEYWFDERRSRLATVVRRGGVPVERFLATPSGTVSGGGPVRTAGLSYAGARSGARRVRHSLPGCARVGSRTCRRRRQARRSRRRLASASAGCGARASGRRRGELRPDLGRPT